MIDNNRSKDNNNRNTRSTRPSVNKVNKVFREYRAQQDLTEQQGLPGPNVISPENTYQVIGNDIGIRI